ncbi:MAG: AAA domain-containing protein, partial [Halobacteriaceae archaeon]
MGNISIDGSQATVEVDENVIEPVISEIDGGTIGGTEVHVTELDETQQAVLEYIDKYSELVDLEREEEMRRHEEEIKSLSGNEREEKGRAILHLEGRDEGEGLGGYHVKFVRHHSGEELPDTEITVGDLVMISKQDPLRDDNPTGTVIEKTKYSLTVAFDSKPQGFVFGSGLRVDLYVNDITFQRMQDALETLPDASGSLKQLRNIIVGVSTPGQAEEVTISEWHNTALNESQKSAVKDALARDDFALIHGPPGTGKTTTAIEVIQQCVDRNESVLATAASNTAVDNIVEFLLDQNVDVVRAGHPARVSPRFHEHTLD